MLVTFWILFSISLITIIVSMIMAPESNSFSGALVGSSDLELFKEKKERGSKVFIKWLMFSLGILIMILSIVIRAIA